MLLLGGGRIFEEHANSATRRYTAFLANRTRRTDRNKSASQIAKGARGWPRRVAGQLNSASRQKEKEL